MRKGKLALSCRIPTVAEKRWALLRLEDVGPGGTYRTLDDLGKLRAVLSYLYVEQVPYQIAVVPRWKNLQSDGTWYNKGIDDPCSDVELEKFLLILREASHRGAVLGMHGYSHQYGDTKRENGEQDSGIGFEFHVAGAPESDTPAYAEERLKKSLSAFRYAGIEPAFWESPHYWHLPEQEMVFQSSIGLIYQSSVEAPEQREILFKEQENAYGKRTLGSVFVPTPLGYIHEENTVEQVLAGLSNLQGPASLFFHPFLEFPSLQAARDPRGNTIMDQGIPVYVYKDENSPLQRVVNGFRKRGFQWASLHAWVPFTPAHRVQLPRETKVFALLFGDVRGVGHADVVVCEENLVRVIPGTYHWPRNRMQEKTQVWLRFPLTPGEKPFLLDVNRDGKQDLLTYHRETGDVRIFYSEGNRFQTPVLWGRLPRGFTDVQPFQQRERTDLIGVQKGEVILVRKSENDFRIHRPEIRFPEGAVCLTGDLNGDRYAECILYIPGEKRVWIYPNDQGRLRSKPVCLTISGESQILLVGDTDGDGQAEILLYASREGMWHVLHLDAFFQATSDPAGFGPWARGYTTAFLADFDGNGKGDIAVYDESRHVLDLALSFHRAHM
jgi:hypothetical protein